MHCALQGPPHCQRSCRLPRPRPVLVPVLRDVLGSVVRLLTRPFSRERRGQFFGRWRRQQIDPPAVVARRLARHLQV